MAADFINRLLTHIVPENTTIQSEMTNTAPPTYYLHNSTHCFFSSILSLWSTRVITYSQIKDSTEGKAQVFWCNFSIILTIFLWPSNLSFIKETRQQATLRIILIISDYLLRLALS